VLVIDPATGKQVSTFAVPQFMDSTLRGLTWRKGVIWVDSQADNRLLQLGPDGHLIGSATTDLLDPHWNYAQDLYLAAVGERVALVLDSHVWVLGVTP
jgi:hypothetical protein